MQDQHFMEGVRRSRSRAHNLELEGIASRTRELAVELLQMSLVALEQAMHRTEFEGVEASEHQSNYQEKHEQLASAVERVMRELRSASSSAPAQIDRIERFVEDNPASGLQHEPMENLERLVDQAKALAGEVFKDPSPQHDNLDGALADLREARADFEREHAEFLDAQDELDAIRSEVYVLVLNARDVLRAALRSADRLDELDTIIPPLADLIGV